MSRLLPHQRMAAVGGAGWVSLAAIGEAVYRVWLRSPAGTWYRYENGDVPAKGQRHMPADAGDWRPYVDSMADGCMAPRTGQAGPGTRWRLAPASAGMPLAWHPGGARGVACLALEAARTLAGGAR